MSENSSKQVNIHAGHRQRMFNKFKRAGVSAFEDHELLEMLLYYTNSRCNTNPLAHMLLEQFGSLAGVLEADIHDLVKVKGVGMRTAEFLHFVHEMFGVYLERKNEFPPLLNSTSLLIDFAKSKYIGKTREEFGIITLDLKCALKGFHIMQVGSIENVSVNVRSVAETALADNAAYVVLCHNHPDGFAVPSEDDTLVTLGLINALSAIGIRVIDHLITAGTECTSMAATTSMKKYFMGQYDEEFWQSISE